MTSGKFYCLRQAYDFCNQSLIASLIEYNGLENVEKWLKICKNLLDLLGETIELKFACSL